MMRSQSMLTVQQQRFEEETEDARNADENNSPSNVRMYVRRSSEGIIIRGMLNGKRCENAHRWAMLPVTSTMFR